MAIIGAVDMGASGPRGALVEIDGAAARLASEITPLKHPNRRRSLVKALHRMFDGIDTIGISLAGVMDPTTGAVRRSGPYPWIEGPLGRQLTDDLGVHVHVVNDAEAHLLAHVSGGAHPMLCVSLGSGLGFALTDDTGRIRHPRSDTCWEVGHFLVRRPDGNDRQRDDAVWALGADGLAEARAVHGSTVGLDVWGDDVGLFVYNMARLFQPATVVFTGGIAAGLESDLTDRVDATLARFWPANSSWAPPSLTTSPFGPGSAIVGAAVAAATSRDR